MCSSLNALRMASTAAWSASVSSPRPITRAEHSAYHREAEGLKKLRNKLVLVEEVEDEETGYLRTVYKGIPLGEASLDDDDRRRLAFVGDAMRDFVMHDRLRYGAIETNYP